MAGEVLPQIAALKLKDKQIVLVDIRPAEERKLAHIAGDVHIPADKCEKELRKYAGKGIVLYCHHGVRSALLAEELEAKGIKTASLAGGIQAWHDKVDSSVPEYELTH